MSAPFSTYPELAEALLAQGIVTDPWLDGAERFRLTPLLLERREVSELAAAAEDLGAAYHELVMRVRDEGDEALDGFFKLSPWQRAMFEMGGDLWHGLARADLFRTAEGLVTTELNCDTPTGEAEACMLGELFATPGQSIDVNRGMASAFLAMNQVFFSTFVEGAAPKTVGLVYPTEFVEDLALVRLYRRWFEAAGFRVVLGSPFNLHGTPAGVELFGERISLLWRHYKTDWWGERETAFDDEALEDVAPLERELRSIDEAQRKKQLVVVNPLSSVLPQNKRAMAYFWERLQRFSTRTQRTVRALIPPTFRLETRDPTELLADKDQWVLKSDYGAEGDEVVVGRFVSHELFRESLAHARPGRWVVQRYFEASPLSPEQPDMVANYGVYLCAGRTAGIYARVHRQSAMTDESALSVAVLVRA